MNFNKVFLIFLSLLFLAVPASAAPGFSLVDNHDKALDDRSWLTYEIDGTNPGVTVVSTSDIPVGSKILGYTVKPIDGVSNDMQVDLYDDDTAAYARSLVINESEKPIAEYGPEWFPYAPRVLQYGLVVVRYGGTKILIHWTP